MNRPLSKILALSFLSPEIVIGSYPEISYLHELRQEWQNADEQTLVIFDIDEVLITTSDHFIHPYSYEIFFKFVDEVRQTAITEEEKQEIENRLSLSMIGPKRFLIEEEAPSHIQELQKKGVKVLGLTSCPSGPWGVIPSIEDWRIEHLKSLDIHFAPSFPLPRSELDELAAPERLTPIFDRGCLFTLGCKKGKTLKAFLKKHGISPSKVIFIDDLAENLQSMKTELESLGIEFKGYHYLGAKRFAKEIDMELLRHQFDHLIREGEWLSDEDVAKRLR